MDCFIKLFVGLIIFLLGICIFTAVSRYNDSNSFCIAQHYDKMTDMKITTRNLFMGAISVECFRANLDEIPSINETRIFTTKYEENCLEYDKWGDCSNTKWVLAKW